MVPSSNPQSGPRAVGNWGCSVHGQQVEAKNKMQTAAGSTSPILKGSVCQLGVETGIEQEGLPQQVCTGMVTQELFQLQPGPAAQRWKSSKDMSASKAICVSCPAV